MKEKEGGSGPYANAPDLGPARPVTLKSMVRGPWITV
jgi:hypothetical protein